MYRALATAVPGAARLWTLIEDEFERSVAELLAVTGRARLLDGAPDLQRSIELRNPYIDSLSEIQVRVLARLRALPPGHPDREGLLRLVHETVSGIAAGLQNTG
jgi:phosphoenolpyruvate carboxylase